MMIFTLMPANMQKKIDSVDWTHNRVFTVMPQM